MPVSAKASPPRRRGGGTPAGGAGRAPKPSGLLPDLLAGLGILVVLVAAEIRRLKSDARAGGHLLGTVALVASVVVVVAVVVTIGLVLGRRRMHPSARGLAGSSAVQATRARRAPEPGWASRSDVRDLQVDAPPGNRIVLGAHGRRLLAAEASQSVLVVGPTQSGKTSGLAIPAIREWAGPVVATSVKSDLVRVTLEDRQGRGRVQLYDPTEATGLTPTSWSPLSAAGTWAGARRLASALCSVARADAGSAMEDAAFWYASAEKLLAPLLLAARSSGAEMTDVVRWIDEEEMREPLLALELAGVPDALRAARTSFGREERQRSSVFATAETIVAGFGDPTVAASSRGAGLQPSDLLDGGAGTLYCCAPAREQERLRPVFVALLRQVIDAAFEQSGRLGHPLDPPLLVVLDEAANIAPIADLDTIVSTAAGHGIQLLTVWQDFSQIEARFGRRWPTIVNNHRAKVLCPGSADPLTLDHMSSLIGEDERHDLSTTVGDDGRWSSTQTASLRRVAPTAALRKLCLGEAVVVYGALPPARVRLRPYYEQSRAVARSRR